MRDQQWGVCIAYHWQQNAELVSTNARHQASVSDNLPEACARYAQHLVADPVAIEVVDRLEVIQIDEKDRTFFVLPQMRFPIAQPFEELTSVGQAREFIIASLAAGLFQGSEQINDATEGEQQGAQSEKKDRGRDLVQLPRLVRQRKRGEFVE